MPYERTPSPGLTRETFEFRLKCVKFVIEAPIFAPDRSKPHVVILIIVTIKWVGAHVRPPESDSRYIRVTLKQSSKQGQ
jgi:hypothetical protein